MKMIRVLILLSVIVSSALSAEEDAPVVKVENGFLRGKLMKSQNGRKIFSFTSIPFAKPPLGELRFQPPQPADPWEEIKNATGIHEDCPQRNIYVRSQEIVGVEDCLYLNVYSPKLPDQDKTLLPVMVFFHGGGWLCGGGNTKWYGPETLLDKDVVLVVPNYRLGALGFLATGDTVVPGNNGLKDQTLTLKWIQKNIAQFGGDPDSVTLFGESAGGASAHYHMLSPMSKGLFKNAISHSGTAFATWASPDTDRTIENSRKLATLFKCPSKNNKEMVQCLRKIDANAIIAQDVEFMEWDTDPMIPFRPVIEPESDNAFLTQEPIDIIKSGRSAQVPWITGVNTEDGAIRSAALYGNPHLIEELDRDFDRIIPHALFYGRTSRNVDYITKQIRKFYFGDKKIDNSTKTAVTDLFTDNWFLIGSDDAVRLHTKYSKHPVYYYLFGYKGVISFSYIFGDKANDYGVCHVDELLYLFPIQFSPDIKKDERDVEEEKFMTTLWTNFAKTSNPTPEVNSLIRNVWKPSTFENLEYFFISDSDTSETRNGPYLERAKFWRDLPLDSRRSEITRDEL